MVTLGARSAGWSGLRTRRIHRAFTTNGKPSSGKAPNDGALTSPKVTVPLLNRSPVFTLGYSRQSLAPRLRVELQTAFRQA